MSVFTILAVIIALSNAFEPEMTYYTEINSGGNALRLKYKTANLYDLSPEIMETHKSYCYLGCWVSYNERNYEMHAMTPGDSYSRRCVNYPRPGIGSARYLGPPDTSTVAITVYEETRANSLELIIEDKEFANIPFRVRSFYTSGYSNWTLYSGTNFNGTAKCYRSTGEFHHVFDYHENDIRSVKEGCPGDMDAYVLSN